MDNNDVFVNFTNHPSDKWCKEQLEAALLYGKVVDVAFPPVTPTATSEEVRNLALKYVDMIAEIRPSAVLCQGEFTMCYSVVSGLKDIGIPVFAACSERMTEDTPEGKITKFVFEGFREYCD